MSQNRGPRVVPMRVVTREEYHAFLVGFPNEMRLLQDLTAVSESHHGTVPFGPTIVRFGPSPGEVSIMNRRRGGWGAFSYTYASLWALARHWRVIFVGFGRDEHSRFIRVEPLPRKDQV